MILKDLKNQEWCKCKERKEGHSAGTLLDGTDLITCNQCGDIVLINGKQEKDIKL